MLRRRAIAYFALLTAVFIWGLNFVIVKKGIDAWNDQTFLFLAARFWVAVIVYRLIMSLKSKSPPKEEWNRNKRWKAALVGIILAGGYGLQTRYLAADRNSAVGAAFLTSTTVLWAPFLARLAFKQRVLAATWAGAILAMTGIVLMEVPVSIHSAKWTLVGVAAAICFAVEILLVSKYAPTDKFESLRWTMVSCFAVAAIMTILAVIRGNWSWSNGWIRVFAVLFTGTVATALALFLQNWAQAQEVDHTKIIDAPRVAIIAALEPVFTTLAVGILLLFGMQVSISPLKVLPTVGCFFILLGTLISEIAAAKHAQKQTSQGDSPAAG